MTYTSHSCHRLRIPMTVDARLRHSHLPQRLPLRLPLRLPHSACLRLQCSHTRGCDRACHSACLLECALICIALGLHSPRSLQNRSNHFFFSSLFSSSSSSSSLSSSSSREEAKFETFGYRFKRNSNFTIPVEPHVTSHQNCYFKLTLILTYSKL